MGKRIKSTGFILDASSTGSAPVSPSGTVAMRAKSDSTQFQYSANGGAWTDFGTGGGGGGTLTGKWLWSNATTGAVATGVIAINNADPSAATEIRIHETSNESAAFAGSFDLVIPGSHIYVQDADDATRWVRYNVTAPATDHGDYRHWPVSLVSYGGVNLNNGEVVNLQFLSSGSGAIPRLDEVLDPAANSDFTMGATSLAFHHTPTADGPLHVIETNTNNTTTGPIVLIRSQGATTNRAPFEVDGRGAFYMNVGVDGKVSIGAATSDIAKLYVQSDNAASWPTLAGIQSLTTLLDGNASETVRGLGLTVIDSGNTTALGVLDGIAVVLSRDATSLDNGALNCKIFGGEAYLYQDTWQVRGLYVKPTIANAATVHAWDALFVDAPNLLSGGTITNRRALITAPGAGEIGFNVLDPNADFHHIGSIQLDIGGDARGDIYYRSSTGHLARLGVGTATQVLTTTDIGGGILEPRWAAGGVGGGPSLPFSSVQYNEAGLFGDIAGSFVSGADVSWAGRQEQVYVAGLTGASTAWTYKQDITFTYGGASATAYRMLDLNASWTAAQNAGTFRLLYANITHNQSATLTSFTASDVTFAKTTGGSVGTVNGYTFQCAIGVGSSGGTCFDGRYTLSGGSLTNPVGTYIEFTRSGGTLTSPIAFWAYASGAVTTSITGFRFEHTTTGATVYGVRLASGSLNGLGIDIPTATLHASGTVRFDLGSDATGDIYYRHSSGNITRLGVGTNGHVLTLAAGVPAWAAASGGPGGTPGTPLNSLQWNSASTFAGVTSSFVSGADVTLGGSLTIRNGASSTDQNILLDAVSANPTRLIFTDYRDAATGSQITWERGRLSGGVHTDLTTNNVVARFLWKGQIPTTGLTQLAFMHGYYTTDYGSPAGVLELGAGGFTLARIFILQGTGVGSNGGVTIYGGASTPYFQVQTAGFQFSGSTNGAMWYTNSSGYFVPTASPSSADSIPYWDNSLGVVGYMTIGTGLLITGTAPNQVLTATAVGGGTPGGSNFELQYNNATAFGGITNSANTQHFLKSSGTGAAPAFTNISALDILSGTLPLSRGGTGSGMIDPNADRIMFWDDSAGAVDWLTAGTGLTITGTTITAAAATTPAGGGSELQYRNAGVFGAVTSSSVTAGGVVTFGGGGTTWKNDASVILSLSLYTSSTALTCPQISILRSRGTEASKSAVLAGDALFSMPVSGQYDSAGQRQGGDLRFDAVGNYSTSSAPTVFRLKTTHVNSNSPNERMVLGGALTLVDNTLTNLFSVTFAAADQKVVGGEIHMLVVAKRLSPSVQTQVYHRKVHFVFAHNGTTNTSAVDVRQDSGVGLNQVASTGGFTNLQHAINAGATVDMTTAITLGTLAEAVTYKVLFNSDLTGTITQFTIYYHIIYHGEADIVLA